MEADQEFLEMIVKMLVDKPDEVQVVRSVDDRGVLLTLSVAQDDMGRVIGKQGNNAQAMRVLLRTFGMKSNARVNLKINEPGGEGVSPASSESRAAASVDAALDDLKL